MHLTDEQLGAYADGELTAAETSTVRKHLDACAACAGELKSLEMLTGRLAQVVEPSAAFEARALAKLRALPMPRAPWWRFVFAPAFRFSAAGAAVVTLAAVGAYEAGYFRPPAGRDAAVAPVPAPMVAAEDAAVAEDADFLEHLDMLEDLDVLEALDGVPG